MTQDVKFWRICFNALLLVRNGITSRAELAERLDLPALTAYDVAEALLNEGYVYALAGPGQVAITRAGADAVRHIALVENVNGNPNVYRRWTPTHPDRIEGVA